MSREKDPECRGLLLAETPNAIQVAALGKLAGQTTGEWWIPRSQIGYMRIDRGRPTPYVVFTCPEWLIEKKQCWALVP